MMYSMNGLEELAMLRVEELRKQGDQVRFLRTLPRRESIARRGVRAFVRMLGRFRPAPAERVLSPRLSGKAEEV